MRLITIAAAAAAVMAFALPVMTAAAADPITIVAAENFYGDLAGEIGGAHVAVTSILSNPDDDPHLFESSPSTARDIAGAAIVIYNGADYDPWMDKLLSASPSKDRAVILAAALTGHKSGDNPHLWYAPETLPAAAKALEAELEKRDPADAGLFKANLDRFITSLAPVTAAIARIKAAHAGTEADVKLAAEKLYAELIAAGVDVILDDRNERPGAMFADWELIGVPHRVTIGDRGLKDGHVEYQHRRDAESTKIDAGGALDFLKSKLTLAVAR